MKNKKAWGLVCAGGGAHGAYQVGVLKYIHQHFSDGKLSPFQIFTGSSCGALNTTFYGAQSYDAYASRLWLEELWMGFHVPMYHGNILKNALKSAFKQWRKRKNPVERQPTWAVLDPKPMRDIVKKGFVLENLRRSLEEGSTQGIAIATTELASGRACWFQEGRTASEWNLFHSVGIVDELAHEHLAASCSVPVFLPPVKISERYFLDGSVSLERPLSAAISMGASHILSIATDQPTPQELPVYPRHFRPRLSNVVRMLLNRLSHDAAADEATQLEMFNRFYASLSRKNRRDKPGRLSPFPLFHEEALPSDYRPVEIFLFFPSRRIREAIGASENLMTDGKQKKDFKPFRKRTRFMFHERFIRELIDLGYEDAHAKHEELKNFFHPRK